MSDRPVRSKWTFLLSRHTTTCTSILLTGSFGRSALLAAPRWTGWFPDKPMARRIRRIHSTSLPVESYSRMASAVSPLLCWWVSMRSAAVHLWAKLLNKAQRWYRASINPFTPKFKWHILPTFQRGVCEWSSENWRWWYNPQSGLRELCETRKKRRVLI